MGVGTGLCAGPIVLQPSGNLRGWPLHWREDVPNHEAPPPVPVIVLSSNAQWLHHLLRCCRGDVPNHDAGAPVPRAVGVGQPPWLAAHAVD